MLVEVNGLLKENELVADDTISNLHKLLAPRVLKSYSDDLVHSIEEFKYDDALSILARIASSLDVSLEMEGEL
ncbi:MAG: hypothetical protein GY854_21020 [Deltaproteobacteria bacterium]|nr:hypothetical protein [Deltaproteobacteria bacterium]